MAAHGAAITLRAAHTNAVGEVQDEGLKVMDRRLRELTNGRAGLQIITIQDRFFETYRREIDFIRRYIFPGGMLPAPTVLRREVEKAGLVVKGSIEFGKSYSQTLRRWYETFNERWGGWFVTGQLGNLRHLGNDTDLTHPVPRVAPRRPGAHSSSSCCATSRTSAAAWP